MGQGGGDVIVQHGFFNIECPNLKELMKLTNKRSTLPDIQPLFLKIAKGMPSPHIPRANLLYKRKEWISILYVCLIVMLLVGLYVDHARMGWNEMATAAVVFYNLKICICRFWIFSLSLQSNSLPSHIKITVNRTNIFEDSFQQVCRLEYLLSVL